MCTSETNQWGISVKKIFWQVNCTHVNFSDDWFIFYLMPTVIMHRNDGPNGHLKLTWRFLIAYIKGLITDFSFSWGRISTYALSWSMHVQKPYRSKDATCVREENSFFPRLLKEKFAKDFFNKLWSFNTQ